MVPSRTHQAVTLSAPSVFVASGAPASGSRGVHEFGLAGGVEANDQVSKEQGSAYTSCPKPLNFFYCKPRQFVGSAEAGATGNKPAGAGNSALTSMTQEREGGESLRLAVGCITTGYGSDSLICCSPSFCEIGKHGTGRAGCLPSGGRAGRPSQWRLPDASTDERDARRCCSQTANTVREMLGQMRGPSGGVEPVETRGGGAESFGGEAEVAELCAEPCHSSAWKQHTAQLPLPGSLVAPRHLAAADSSAGMAEE